jgi:hypothetical protein
MNENLQIESMRIAPLKTFLHGGDIVLLFSHKRSSQKGPSGDFKFSCSPRKATQSLDDSKALAEILHFDTTFGLVSVYHQFFSLSRQFFKSMLSINANT